MSTDPKPPPYSTPRGYSPLPTNPPPGGPVPLQTYPPYPQPQPYPQGYAPAPPVLGAPQQQQSNNVVVVGQPAAQPVGHTLIVQPRAQDYLVLSIVMTALCFVCGFWVALFCTIPAIIFGIIAASENDAGNYQQARTHGSIALGCNIAVLVSFAVAVVIVVIIGILYTTGVIAASDITIDTYCYYHYSYYYDSYTYTCV